MKFPVSTKELSQWLPHRAPALWVDEVLRVGEEDGECRVNFSSSAHYSDGSGRIRESSFVEWIAQAYGFVGACQAMSGLLKIEKKPEKAFLVQVRDLEMGEDLRVADGDSLIIQVRRTHQVGPVTLIEGSVMTPRGSLLAKARLKLFAE